ncbi:MAG TPA: MBL fold metallo-hydrolase [Candidatus Woesearchaeota archaeon]|jgi:L-ascorbate metabolism protein UlaG (beta-lactamase superfamily)|nr:MBL fold metallo-hydrolase [Candidatus Woesearchaeota archaeon]
MVLITNNLVELNNVSIEYLGHAGFRIKILDKNIKIYIDPYNLSNPKGYADYIFITHPHFDHYSPKDISKIRTPQTKIIVPSEISSEYPSTGTVIQPSTSYDFINFGVDAIEAYNKYSSYHPKDKNWVGYLFKINGIKIYHCGDTDYTPEMSVAYGCDIIMIPIGGKFTMNSEEAAEACNHLKPKLAIPMHYGNIVGTSEEPELFREKAPCEVAILYPVN